MTVHLHEHGVGGDLLVTADTGHLSERRVAASGPPPQSYAET
jgi:hypothetical protein